MGGGSYVSSAHRAATADRGTKAVQEVFQSRSFPADMDLRNKPRREARDSAAHPRSLPIIFALDVTGSMGHIPADLAKRSLPDFMEVANHSVEDPQLCFVAFGDHECDRAPIQVGEFESEGSLMDHWLTTVWLEGGGGGNAGESYGYPFHFAASHTDTDAWEKRGQKGYLFITGDEPALTRYSKSAVEQSFGTSPSGGFKVDDAIARAQERYHCFFIIPDPGREGRVGAHWRQKLGDHVIVCEQYGDMSDVCGVIMGLTEGTFADLGQAATMLIELGRDREAVGRVIRTVTAYATSIGRGEEETAPTDDDMPSGDGSSRNQRNAGAR